VTNPSYHIGPGRPTTTSQRKEAVPKKVKKNLRKRKASKSTNDRSKKAQKQTSLPNQKKVKIVLRPKSGEKE